MLWIKSDNEKNKWVEKFKKIFINNLKHEIETIFDIESFGIHNSLNIEAYCQHEFDEFKLKCEKFELVENAPFVCYDLPDNMFYFSIGKKDDLALFEGIFTWVEEKKLAIGNQYPYKTEPKIQFIKNDLSNKIEFKRRINIKSDNIQAVKKVMINGVHEDEVCYLHSLDDVFGGAYYSYTYDEQPNNLITFWSKLKIYSSDGISKYNILLRGVDHPLFQDNLFAVINSNNNGFKILDNCWPVIVNVILDDGSEHSFKYPKEKDFLFEKRISEICVTDNLSYDWITRRIS